ATDLMLNGGASINGSQLLLTDGNGSEARSAFTLLPEGVDTFDTTFEFSFKGVTPAADGFTFTIQNDPAGSSAVGGGGGNLGYVGIANSIMLKFDIWDSPTGTPTNSQTGVYIGDESDDPRQGVS